MKSWLSWPFGGSGDSGEAENSQSNRQSNRVNIDRADRPRPRGDLSRALTFPLADPRPALPQSRYHSDGCNSPDILTTPLCSLCRDIDFQGLTTRDRKPKERYDITYGRTEPFSSNCPLCKLLCETCLGLSINEAASQVVTFDFVPIYATSIRGDKDNVVEGLWFRSGAKFGHLVFSASVGDPASAEIQRRPPVNDYNCEQAYDIACRWLGECFIYHNLCPRDVEVPLPTRVIDIGNATRDPRLFVPRPGARSRYLALSYCWGEGQPLTLTEERLRNLPVLFPLKTLPRTLRDAIVIARHLGFRFIWIDALCIVQDSAGSLDWKQESQNMDQIYGNASLTIAAAAAASTTQGILFTCAGQEQPKCSLPYQLLNGQWGSVSVEAYKTTEPPPEALDSRAWALQESLLSRRILRYGSTQMSWKCNRVEENANGPVLNWNKQPRSKTEDWTIIVTDYTARTLTYNSDRLAALSGYAKLLGSKRPYDEYLAGLWRSELPAQLLWYRSLKSRLRLRPFSYIAPSWSWASIDGAVRFSFAPPNYQFHTEVLSVSMPTSSNNQYSPIDVQGQSLLSMHGYIKRLEFNEYFQQHNMGGPFLFTKHKFQSNRRQGSDQPSGEIILDILGPFDHVELGNDDTSPSLVCLHMTPTFGLILLAKEKHGDWKKDLYERIGFATGSVFEDWFGDASCGSYRDRLVRII